MTQLADTPQSYGDVLRRPSISTLMAGDALSKIGDGMTFVALPVLALRLHGDVPPALAVSLVTAAPYLVPVGLSLFFGLGKRRFRPRPVLLADCALRGLVFVILATLAWHGSLGLWALVGALLGGSVLRLLASSGLRLAFVDMVSPRGRLAVNGLLGTSESFALYLVGPALGGLLIVVSGPALVLLIDGLSYLLLLGAVAVAVPRASASEEVPPAANESGWAVLQAAHTARRLFVIVFLFNLFYGPVEVALPLLITADLHDRSTALGVLWTCFGVGALTGGLLTNQLRRIPAHTLLIGVIGGWAACMVALSQAPTLTVACAAIGVGGLIYGPFTAVSYTTLQNALLPEQQQPVLTLWAAGLTVAVPLGIAFGGPLVTLVGARGALLASAVSTALLVPPAMWRLRPGVR